MSETVYTNARVVLADRVIHGSIAVRDGVIRDYDAGVATTPAALDMEGDYLLPGLVEMHTDHVEAHAYPRPKVRWPLMPALTAFDAAIVSAGITTVFDAIALGHDTGKEYRRDLGDEVISALADADRAGILRAEHRLHLRCEIAVPGLIEQFDRHIDDPRVGLVSLMDHTPGQRQFVDLEAYRRYYMGKYGLSEAELAGQIEERIELQRNYAAPQRAHVVAGCRERDVHLASHDDASAEHVAQAADSGVRIAEFPTTQEAADAARRAGLITVMGAPNMVRGGSHSGNVAATDLAERGLLDAFSSDYVPVSLLDAAWRLTGLGYSLPAAVATVTANPAQILGLTDRGRIEPGRRADLVRVRALEYGPVVRQVWRSGERVA